MIITAAGPILLLILIAIKRNHTTANLTAAFTLTAAFIAIFFVKEKSPYHIGELLIIDDYALFFLGVIFVAGIVIILLSNAYLERTAEDIEEYYVLILLAILGSTTLVVGNHFVTFFLGLEVLSTSLYVLVAFLREREQSIEAGVKYLILAASASAFILFGMALIYSKSGTMYFPAVAVFLSKGHLSLITLGGIGLIIVGVGFKLAVVPFHLWTADIYEGAPAPVTALIATISKGGVFALWLRFVMELHIFNLPSFITLLAIISAASMLVGNLLALLQKNVKRILAYSSIAHMGYLLVAFLAGNHLAVEASTFYLVAYIITSLGAFGTVIILSGKERDEDDLSSYTGMFWKKPWLAAIFTAMLLSLAGIPLTVGFVGKFYVLMAGVNVNLWWLVIVLVVSSVIGLYYYLRIVVTMFLTQEDKTRRLSVSTFSFTNLFVFASLTVLLIGLGLYPTVLIDLIRNFAVSF